MRVVGKACAGLDAEVVEHEEGREVAQLGRSDGTAHTGAGTFCLLDGKEDLTNRARDRHVGSYELLGRIIEVGFLFRFRCAFRMFRCLT